jgi:hypothetical protein
MNIRLNCDICGAYLIVPVAPEFIRDAAHPEDALMAAVLSPWADEHGHVPPVPPTPTCTDA